MSNTETRSEVLDCGLPSAHDPERVQLIEPKDVQLGDAQALRVRRTLPSLRRSFVGAWCFVDHYGPQRGICMDVPPHPHTGLQTVSWLFEGEIEHRDSGGVHAMVRPGEVNLMTSGHGIAHSEVSTPARDLLHGVQLWVVLPDASKGTRRPVRARGRLPRRHPAACRTAVAARPATQAALPSGTSVASLFPPACGRHISAQRHPVPPSPFPRAHINTRRRRPALGLSSCREARRGAGS